VVDEALEVVGINKPKIKSRVPSTIATRPVGNDGNILNGTFDAVGNIISRIFMARCKSHISNIFDVDVGVVIRIIIGIRYADDDDPDDGDDEEEDEI
jgi:hypothetical protein